MPLARSSGSDLGVGMRSSEFKSLYEGKQLSIQEKKKEPRKRKTG